MDKNLLFETVKPTSIDYTLPTGDVIQLYELTAKQRKEVFKIENVIDSQVMAIALSCPDFDVNDIEQLSSLPGELINDMSLKIFKLSNLYGEDQKKD